MDTDDGGTRVVTEEKDAREAITEEQARTHDIAPAHVRGVEIETVDPAQEVSLDIPRPRAAPRGGNVDLG